MLRVWCWRCVDRGGAEPYTLHSFQKLQLSDQFFCEGADLRRLQPRRRDGRRLRAVLVCRAEVHRAARVSIRPQPFDIDGYSENFFAFTHDVNGDGWTDIVVIGFPGRGILVVRNPQGKAGHWQRHVILPVTDNESPTFTDVTGDGRPELVCSTGGQLGYAEIPDGRSDAAVDVSCHLAESRLPAIHARPGRRRRERRRPAGPAGKRRLVGAAGRRIRRPSSGQFHDVPFAEAGGAQMLVYDVDGDGDNDVVTSKAAHAYGLVVVRKCRRRRRRRSTFHEHLIMGEKPEQNEYGVAFSQLHALALADMDRDGVQDIVTGKRFWAHAEHDPGSLDPAVLYWFQTVRDGGKVRFVPYQIDNNSGVGTQVVAGDLNGDKLAGHRRGQQEGHVCVSASGGRSRSGRRGKRRSRCRLQSDKRKQAAAKPQAVDRRTDFRRRPPMGEC